MDTIYFEEAVTDHPRTREIFSRFKTARKISIERYGEIFNKRDQNFKLQKRNPALILAKKHKGFVLPVPDGFGIGHRTNYYFSHMYNCIYDCRYCFLQGMYSSANYVIFVNYEDFSKQIEVTINAHKGHEVAFFSGYDCDSLALENVTRFASFILPLFKKHPTALLELRTKSIQLKPMINSTVLKNCIVAFSLMPETISKSLDNKAPTIERRIDAMKRLALKGWKLGLRFDPLIHGKGWKVLYRGLIEQIFHEVPIGSIHSISFGALRFPTAMYKRIHSMYPDEILFSGPLSNQKGLIAYKSDVENEMISFCRGVVSEFVSEAIIFNCSFDPNTNKELIL